MGVLGALEVVVLLLHSFGDLHDFAAMFTPFLPGKSPTSHDTCQVARAASLLGNTPTK